MTPLEKFREVVAATRASGGKFVVRTLDEAQALLDELDGPAVITIGSEAARLLADTFKDGFKPGIVRLVAEPPGDDEVI